MNNVHSARRVLSLLGATATLAFFLGLPDSLHAVTRLACSGLHYL